MPTVSKQETGLRQGRGRSPDRTHADHESSDRLPASLGNRSAERALRALRLEALAGPVFPKRHAGGEQEPAEREADQGAASLMHGGGDCCGHDHPDPCPSCRRRNAAEAGVPRLGGGDPLGSVAREFFEARSGVDLGDIRIHTDARAQAAAEQLQAKAFTIGLDIAFGRDQYRPDTGQGRLLLAHELSHVLLDHTGIHRMMIDNYESAAERAERLRPAREHRAKWVGLVEGQFGRELGAQTQTVHEELERTRFAVIAQRAAALEAAAGWQGWLNWALIGAGYSGPDLKAVKQAWGEAVVAAEALSISAGTEAVSGDVMLVALSTIPAFYGSVAGLAGVLERAHRTRADAENARRDAAYRERLERYEANLQNEKLNRQWMAGDLGGRAALGGMALARGDRPKQPELVVPPPAVTSEIPAASARLYAAQTGSEWQAVADDLNRIGNRFVALVVATLPETSEARQGLEYVERLEKRLAEFETTYAVSERIPAVFYPDDRIVTRPGPDGKTQTVAEAIPWQFYLVNTGVRSRERPAQSGGEWVLVDITSPKRFENRAPSTDVESAMFQQGAINPPLSLFSQLNSRLRFPKGRLYFKLGRTSYVLMTTEPWSLSDFFAALGMLLAAVALVAMVVATGGVAGAGAVALLATAGGTVAGVASSLTRLSELAEQGALKDKDVEEAMISIGIDLVSLLSLGLGRLVAVPRVAARLGLTGERFIALQKITQVARAGALGGDLYQAYALTKGLVEAFNAIETQPGLTKEERDKMRAQLVRRALITGALLTIAIRGDFQDYRAGRTLQATHVDPDGALAARPMKEVEAEGNLPREHADAPEGPRPGGSAHPAAPHAQVTGPAHANAAGAGGGVALGTQSHALGVAGTGRMRDFYFCSDLCGLLVERLEAVAAALPRNHPHREAVRDMLKKARGASKRLKAGDLAQEEANAVAQELGERIGRLGKDSDHFAALMNTDPGLLLANAPAIRQRLAQAIDDRAAWLRGQSTRQAETRQAIRGQDPDVEPRSALETDLLGNVDMQVVNRPSRRLQRLHFDTGNFSHTYAEALVPGLPRGLADEVKVTLPDGTVGRADRVRFLHDADGDIIGAHVYEIKPDIGDNVAKGREQVKGYVDGLRADIEAKLREKGKTMPATAPDGGPAVRGEVVTYNYERMVAVLRALRARRRDLARMADLEAIAREVFSGKL